MSLVLCLNILVELTNPLACGLSPVIHLPLHKERLKEEELIFIRKGMRKDTNQNVINEKANYIFSSDRNSIQICTSKR
jgi:hypothetical protein